MRNRRIIRRLVQEEDMERPFIDGDHLTDLRYRRRLGPAFPRFELVPGGLELLARPIEGIARRVTRPRKDPRLDNGWDALGQTMHTEQHRTRPAQGSADNAPS